MALKMLVRGFVPCFPGTREIESHLVSLGLGSKRGATGSKISVAAGFLIFSTEQVNLMFLKMRREE